jgi:hypothetical protein
MKRTRSKKSRDTVPLKLWRHKKISNKSFYKIIMMQGKYRQ